MFATDDAATAVGRSEGHPFPEPVGERPLVVVRFVGDDLLGGFDDRPPLPGFDDDEVVFFQRRESGFEVVDLHGDRRPEFEDGHPVVDAVDERVEDRHLRRLPVPILPLCFHLYTHSTTRDLTFAVPGRRDSVLRYVFYVLNRYE